MMTSMGLTLASHPIQMLLAVVALKEIVKTIFRSAAQSSAGNLKIVRHATGDSPDSALAR